MLSKRTRLLSDSRPWTNAVEGPGCSASTGACARVNQRAPDGDGAAGRARIRPDDEVASSAVCALLAQA